MSGLAACRQEDWPLRARSIRRLEGNKGQGRVKPEGGKTPEDGPGKLVRP